jgi:hypothetical protein
MIVRFIFVCIGSGVFVAGLGLTITGIGAIFGIPMMAFGMGLVESNSAQPRRP